MPNEPKLEPIEAEDVTPEDSMEEIDRKLEEAAEKVLGKPATDETEETAPESEGAEAEGSGEGTPSTPGLTALTVEELSLATEAGMTPTEIQEFQSQDPAARSYTLRLLAGRPKAGQQTAQPGLTDAEVNEHVSKLVKPIPDAAIKSFVESVPGADESKVRALMNEVQRAAADPVVKLAVNLLGLVQMQQAEMRQTAISTAGRILRRELVTKYPELGKGESFTSLVNDPATRKLVEAHQERGLDLGTAAERAITERIAATYGARTQAKPAKQEARKASLKGTPEPGERTRQGTITQVKMPVTNGRYDIDDVLDKAFDLVTTRKQSN